MCFVVGGNGMETIKLGIWVSALCGAISCVAPVEGTEDLAGTEDLVGEAGEAVGEVDQPIMNGYLAPTNPGGTCSGHTI